MAEQLICNQQVDGSTPFTSSNMGDFPSGQRGQTVNLLSLTSLVRIQHPPPKNDKLCLSFFHLCPQDTTSLGEAHIICGVIHNIIFRHRTQNDVALRANEVLRNEVLASLEMMLRLRRKRNLTVCSAC